MAFIGQFPTAYRPLQHSRSPVDIFQTLHSQLMKRDRFFLKHSPNDHIEAVHSAIACDRALRRCGLSLCTRCSFCALYGYGAFDPTYTRCYRFYGYIAVLLRHLAAWDLFDILMQVLQLHAKDHGAVTPDRIGTSRRRRFVARECSIEQARACLRWCALF